MRAVSSVPLTRDLICLLPVGKIKEDLETLGAENFTREILHYCPSRGVASYLEAQEQFEREVLLTDDYYNGIINVRVGGSKILRESLKKD